MLLSMLRTRFTLAYNHRAFLHDKFQKCFLSLGGAAFFATQGVQKVSIRPIIHVVVSGEFPVHNALLGAEPRST